VKKIYWLIIKSYLGPLIFTFFIALFILLMQFLWKYIDELVPVPGPVGIEWSRKLARKEGIFTGISGGASFAAALQIAEKTAPGSVILCMLPDTGERYLSSPLFEGIAEAMTEEENALSLSTPGFHMPPA